MIRQFSLVGLGLILCLSFSVSPLQAQTIQGSAVRSVFATGAGAQGSGFGLTNPNADLLNVGQFISNAGPANVVALYSFELPDLGAVANPFATADLDFQFSGFTSRVLPLFNVDLYGIDLRPTNEPAFTDFFVGPGPDSRGTTVTLQEDILTPASTVARIRSLDIASYLNNLYDGGAGVGQFAYFRLSPDFANPSINAGTVGYAVFSTNGPAQLDPVINFTGASPVPLLGDVNLDDEVDFLDIAPFIALLSAGTFQAEADIDGNNQVDFLDIAPFISILSGS